ncbi:MAG: hypothetical protein XD96_0938 [Petrotoga mobilis]|jgi:hypothetical protein|nr:MAG: hypothetical protein XD96_0938 [Petrotoga mobilis]
MIQVSLQQDPEWGCVKKPGQLVQNKLSQQRLSLLNIVKMK